MFSFLMSDAGMTAISLVGGFLMRAFAENEKRKDIQHKRWVETVSVKDTSMNAAAERTQGNGGTWMRRAIFGLVAISLIIVWVAPFLDQSVFVEVDVEKGVLFWKKTVKEFVEVTGVLLPTETRQAFMLLCGFYLGQGVK